MLAGAIIQYRLRLHGLPVDWLTRIDEWEPGVRFVDAQLAGPLPAVAPHPYVRARGDGTLMRDTVRYALPLGRSGAGAAAGAARPGAIFDFRRDSVGALLERG